MIDYEGVFDGQTIESNNTKEKMEEERKIKAIIGELERENDYNRLREIYTDILLDDNVIELITEISFSKAFVRDFPEFYIKNKFGEDVINCTQINKYHRYGVFKHILVSVEEVSKNTVSFSDSDVKILKWTMLLHDIGKPIVKKVSEDGSESFFEHEIVSCQFGEKILDRFLFDDNDKKLILTLIKYHDMFLNDSELIYDNFKFLAEELLNSKENFRMLIEVKSADSMAKSIQTSEQFKIQKKKYLEFMDAYFVDNNIIIQENENLNSEEKMTEMEYEVVYDNMIKGNNIMFNYQPIIDVINNKVEGYEILSRIKDNENFDIGKFLRFAKEKDDFSKVDQVLFIKAMEQFDEINCKESDVCFININVNSYEEYINKPRIYDYFEKYKLVVEFSNYEYYTSSELQAIISKIKKYNGKVSLNAFGSNEYTLEDLRFIDLDYLKLDINICKNILNDESKGKYVLDLLNMCESRGIKLVALGVETKEVYDKLKSLGIRFMQGHYLSSPLNNIVLMNDSLKNIINNGDNEIIS